MTNLNGTTPSIIVEEDFGMGRYKIQKTCCEQMKEFINVGNKSPLMPYIDFRSEVPEIIIEGDSFGKELSPKFCMFCGTRMTAKFIPAP